jgi:regulatory protein
VEQGRAATPVCDGSGVWHKKGVTRRAGPRSPKPLDAQSLSELALAYVARFATSRAKLASYLRRKLRERGWVGDEEPPIDAVVERCCRSGFVDDRAYALSKSQVLARRGYGENRLAQSLRAAGISEDDAGPARRLAAEEAGRAALRFAERRRIGPFAREQADLAGRQKALAAMVRAGHSFDLARRIVDCRPGHQPDLGDLDRHFIEP